MNRNEDRRMKDALKMDLKKKKGRGKLTEINTIQ